MSELDKARDEARARRGEDEPASARQLRLDAYATVDALVVEDLIETYHDRQSPDVEVEVATIDHPYRTYFVEGQRSVVLAIREVVAAAKRGEDL